MLGLRDVSVPLRVRIPVPRTVVKISFQNIFLSHLPMESRDLSFFLCLSECLACAVLLNGIRSCESSVPPALFLQLSVRRSSAAQCPERT